MPESQPLAKLASVVTRLHEASEALNQKLAELEQALVDMRPGITVWCSSFLTKLETSGTIYGSQLGFTKSGRTWGLWVRRGEFEESFPGDWAPRDHASVEVVRLVDASREERVAALTTFDHLVKELTHEVQAHLETLERANKEAR